MHLDFPAVVRGIRGNYRASIKLCKVICPSPGSKNSKRLIKSSTKNPHPPSLGQNDTPQQQAFHSNIEGIWDCLLGLNEAELMLKLLETERINNICQHHPVPKSDFRFKNNMKCGFDGAKRDAFWYFNYCHVYTLVIKQSHCHIASYNRTSRTTPAKRTSSLELYI